MRGLQVMANGEAHDLATAESVALAKRALTYGAALTDHELLALSVAYLARLLEAQR